MAWDENKKIKFVIDHNKVDDTLHDFPVTMKISDSCGINLVNLTTTSGTTASGTIFEEATSALSPNYDFTGNDGDGPDWRQFYYGGINAMTYNSIQNNKLNYYSDTAQDSWISSNYQLVGDFDWQIDFELVSHPSTNSWSHHFMLTSTGFTVYMIREYAGSTDRYRSAFYRLGVNAGGGANTSRDDLTGKIRFVRTGGTVYCYYWNAGWVLQATSGFSDCTEPLRVAIRPWQDSGPALVEANFDNVQLNSGSVHWEHLRSKIAVYAGGDQNTGTKCFIDLEHWNTINEEIVIHVGVPEISHTEDTELYLYYDEDNNTNTTGYPLSWWASLTPEEASDSFPVDGTPNEALWYDVYAGAYVENGLLVMDLSSGNTYDDLGTTYTIYGDFDIQVDFDVSSAPTTDGWYIGLHANTANSDLTYKGVFSRRRYDISNGHNYNSGHTDGGPWTSVYTPTTSGSGKLRITREDQVVKSYYYEDGSWQLNITGTLTNLDNVPMGVHLQGSSNVGEPTYSAYFDNFTVNKAFIITDNYAASDTFPESDYSQPNREKWRPYTGGTNKFVIKDNSLYVDAPNSTGATTYNTHWLEGDFDVQVDFNLVTWPSTDVGYAYMRFQGRDSSDDYMTGYCGRRYDSSKPNTNMYFASFYDSGWTGETSVATSDTTGKFRYYRSGNIIYSQYWNGASWTTLDSEDFGAAPEVYIYLQAGAYSSNAGVEVKFGNFKVNSTRRMRGDISSANSPPASNVWDPRYRFVCHFGQYDYVLGGYSNRVYDATSFHRRGTANTNMTYSDQVDSQVGKAFDFDGTDDYINFGDQPTIDGPGAGDFTVEVLVKGNASPNTEMIVSKGNQGSTDEGWSIWQGTNLYVRCNASDDASERASQALAYGELDTNWHTIALVLNHTDEKIYGYKNASNSDWTPGGGGPADDDITGFNIITTDELAIAAVRNAGGTYVFGEFIIDEVRISNIVRSPVWIETTHYSLFDDLHYIDWLEGPQGFDANQYINFFVDHRRVDDMVSNFPVRFRISKQSGIDNIDITRIFDELNFAARKKIAVTTADGTTQCYVEIEDWDDSRQEANLWIKAPSLSPQQQTEFYLYYDSTADDNTDWVGDTGDTAAQNVWDSNFQAVYHLGEDPTVSGSASMKDSTSNVRHGTPSGFETEDRVDGKSGYAINADGTDSEIVNIGTWDPGPNRMTMEFIYNMDQTPTEFGANYHSVVKRDTWNSADMRWQLNGVPSDDKWRLATNSDAGILFNYIITTGEWKQLTITYNSAADEALYIDGVFQDSHTALTFDSDTAAHLALLQRYEQAGTNGHPGKMQEVRFSDKIRSDAWIKSTYYSNWDDLIYFRMPWDDTHSEIKLTISGSLINEDLTNFPLTLTLASGVGTNTEDVTKIFDGLTLSGTLGYSDDFTGWNGNDPNPLLWTLREDDGSETIQSNKFNCVAVDPGAGHFPGVSAKFSLDDDFDMQFDWDATYIENADWNAVYVQVAWPSTGGGSNRVLMRMRNTTVDRNVSGYWESDGTPDGYYDSSEPSITTSKFRVQQSGTTIRLYYWKTGAWQEIQSPGKTISGATVPTSSISFWAHAQGGDITVDFDNFTVTSGTVHANQTRKKIAIFSGGDQYTGDKCFTEIEHWDAVNETATLHVQVPTLTSGTDTDLYLYEDINQPDQDYRLISEANDTFTAASGTAPDHTKWRVIYASPEIRDNRLFVTSSGGGIDSGVMGRYALEGDFDIQYDWELIDAPSTQNWALVLEARDKANMTPSWDGNPEGDVVSISRRYDVSGHGYNFYTYDGSWTSRGSAYSLNHTTGKLRMVRTGDLFECFYWSGGWTSLGTYTFTGIASDLNVAIGIVSWTGNPTPQGYIDNFTVTSGTVTGFVDDTGGRPAQEVWDSNFEGVWHMAQEPSGADDILDSTSNVAHGTSQNMEAADLKDSQVGKALEFDGSNEWIDMGDVAATDPGTGELTVETLVKGNSTAALAGIVTKGNRQSTSEGWSIWQDTSTLRVRCNSSDDAVERASQTLTGGQLDTNWHTVGLVLDHTDEKIYGYKDGSNSGWVAGGGGPADDVITGFDIDTSDELAIAAFRDASTTYYEADITVDEVRISSTARTPEWISTTHGSLFDALVFYDLLIPTPTPPTPPTPSGLADAAGWTSINDVLTSGIVVRLYRRLDGELVGEDISATISGIWNIPTTYDEYHYAVGLYPVSGTNSLIYDWLHPTLNP